jgi:hypothetical protein
LLDISLEKARSKVKLMEKGEGIRKVTFLCIVIADAIILGAVVAYAVDTEKYHNLRDPTYREALQFIGSDETDRNQYNQSYRCTNFADDFMNNAFRAGYRCGYVTIEFLDINHAIVCFNTSDNGLIFIEPQSDEIVALATEKPYLGRMVLQFSVTWIAVSESRYMLVLFLAFLPPSMLGALQVAEDYRKKHPSFPKE